MHFKTTYYPALCDHIVSLSVINPHHNYIFPSRLALVENVSINLIIITLLLLLLLEVFTSTLTDGFSHGVVSDSKSPQVSRIRLRILAVLSNAVVWIVSTRPPTSKSSRPLNNPLVIVPNAPIIISTIVTFMFHCFFNSLARSKYLSFFSLSFRFILWSAGTAKSTILQILFFYYYKVWSSGLD